MYLRLLKQGTRKVQIHKYTNAKYPARVSADNDIYLRLLKGGDNEKNFTGGRTHTTQNTRTKKFSRVISKHVLDL